MTTAHGEPADPVPTGRFEWERLVRRAVIPANVKFLALILGSYADPDGSRVRPGQAVLAAVTGFGERTVRRLLTDLVGLGFIEQVSRGGGRGRSARAATYRLTIPTDLLDRVQLLPVAERHLESVATQVAGQSEESPATQGAGDCGQPVESPVDNSGTAATQVAGETVGGEPIDRPLDDSSSELTGQPDPIDRPPGWPTTTQLHQPPKRDHPSSSDPAHPQTARTDTSQNDHGREGGGARAAPPDHCPHDLPRRTRRDGQPACPRCRRAQAQEPPP